jgi:MFS family permease
MINWFSAFPEDKYVKTNFFLNVFDGAFYSFGMSFISLVAIIPVFVRKIGGSSIEVGLIPVFWTIGFNFPQIFFANHVRKLHYKKNLLLKTAFFQRIPWFLLSIFCFFIFEKISGSLGIILFFFLFLLAAVAGSINLPGWFDLIAKLTPVPIRGRLFALRIICGALLGILGGLLAERIINGFPFPYSFGVLFLCAYTVMMISYMSLTKLKEEFPNPANKQLKYKDFFKFLPGLLKKEKNYRNYLIADALLTASLMADAFYAVNAIKKFALPDSYAGIFSAIIMVSMMAGNIIYGYLADHFGHKLNLLIAASSTTIACLIALTASNIGIYFIAFIGSASSTSLIQLSRLAIIAELAAEEDRPTYIALTNVITSPFILISIAGGWFADQLGYSIVFILAGSFALLSALWFYTMVKEPRFKNLPAVN